MSLKQLTLRNLLVHESHLVGKMQAEVGTAPFSSLADFQQHYNLTTAELKAAILVCLDKRVGQFAGTDVELLSTLGRLLLSLPYSTIQGFLAK